MYCVGTLLFLLMKLYTWAKIYVVERKILIYISDVVYFSLWPHILCRQIFETFADVIYVARNPTFIIHLYGDAKVIHVATQITWP